MRILWALMKKRIWILLITILISIASIVISMLWNYKVAQAIDLVSEGRKMGEVLILSIVGVMILSMVMQTIFTFMSGYSCERLNHDLRVWYVGRYMTKDITFFDDMSTGQQLSELQNEVHEVSLYISNHMFQLIDDIIKFVGTFTWIIMLNAPLALLANLPVVLIVLYVTYTSKVLKRLASSSQQSNQHMNGMADTILTLFPIIKLYEAGRMMTKQYHSSVEVWEKTSIKEERIRAGLMSISAILSCLPLLLLLLIGGQQVVLEKIEIGILYIFVNLSGNVSGVMMNMPGQIANFRRFAANMARLQR